MLAPEQGTCLHDTLDDNSHKHAYAVSTDLEYGARRAVELLGNEVIRYRREVLKQGVFDDSAYVEATGIGGGGTGGRVLSSVDAQ